MTVIKVNQLAKYLMARERKAETKAMKRWQRLAKPLLEYEILSRIAKGISPVAGQGKYQKYSEKYKIGKKRPVNLKNSGEMIASIYSKNVRGGVEVGFKSKTHKYVNSWGKVRRATIPHKAERFKRDITKKLSILFKKVFRIK